jgi:hypothetical protein
MKPGPSLAKSILVASIGVDQSPRSARDWLVSISLSQQWHLNESDASEAAEKWQERLLHLLGQELSELNQLGRFCPFQFNSSSRYLIQGSAFIEPRDDAQTQEAKRRRAQHDRYALALMGLAPRAFEALCAGLLESLGVHEPRLTTYSADEGIDFYGEWRLGDQRASGIASPWVQRQLSVWMLGQAKHHSAGQVSTFEIRELVGSVELAKSRAYGSAGEKYADLRLRVCDPVFYLFFTTGRISSASWRLIASSGVAAMDGNMIANFLAERGIGADQGGVFQEDAFAGWIAMHAS